MREQIKININYNDKNMDIVELYTHPKYREYGKKLFEGVNKRYSEYAKQLESKINIPSDTLIPFIFILIRACVLNNV